MKKILFTFLISAMDMPEENHVSIFYNYLIFMIFDSTGLRQINKLVVQKNRCLSHTATTSQSLDLSRQVSADSYIQAWRPKLHSRNLRKTLSKSTDQLKLTEEQHWDIYCLVDMQIYGPSCCEYP